MMLNRCRGQLLAHTGMWTEPWRDPSHSLVRPQWGSARMAGREAWLFRECRSRKTILLRSSARAAHRHGPVARP